MYFDVTNATYSGKYQLDLHFADGSSGKVDFAKYIEEGTVLATACRVILKVVRSVFGGLRTYVARSGVLFVLWACPAGVLRASSPGALCSVSRSGSSPCAQPVRAPACWC